MTPYNTAASLLKNSVASDEIVARLVASGLTASDAKIVLRAAWSTAPAPAPVEVEVEAQPVPPRPPQRRAEPKREPEAVRPGFHGWLLVAVIVLSIKAVIAGGLMLVAGVPLMALALSLDPTAIAKVTFDVANIVLLVAGTAALLDKRRRAVELLTLSAAFSIASGVHECLAQLMAGGGFNPFLFVIGLLWLTYFRRSKQLRATCTK